MTDTYEVVKTDFKVETTSVHPLEPLSAKEITAAIHIARSERQLGERVRFVTVGLHEPSDKEVVLQYREGDPVSREASLIVLDNTDGAAYTGVVSLTEEKVLAWHHVAGVQPSIMLDEFFECEQMLKAHPDFQAALRKRGITDFSLVMVDPWSAGYYGAKEERELRLTRTLSWVRAAPDDNGYAHPIEGVLALVDLNKMELVRIDDYGVLPIPPLAGNYTPDAVGKMRNDLKPIEIKQPDGPSFRVKDHAIEWQKWHFRIGFTQREGLVLHTVSYKDQGRMRPVLYRAALAEMLISYGDPRPAHYRQNAFDMGEYGIGMLANSLEMGCDCLGHIHYFDATFTDSRGNLVTVPNAICLHEEDAGMLWKHIDWRNNQTEVRRSRRLVVSFVATVGNYEYGFYWYFYQDGNIQFKVKLTGIMHMNAVPPGEKSKYGQMLAPLLNAPNHQHIFNMRLDMTVDGTKNSVYEVHTESEPPGPENPHHNAYFVKSTLLATEAEAQQTIDPLSARYWKIVNPNVCNAVGEPVAYKLMPGDNTGFFIRPEAHIHKRAIFATKHLWVTPYQPAERYPAGDYPNQHPGGAGLPEWTRANRSLENTDVVLWYTMIANHIARLEDWPLMPVSSIGFMLKPVGFFDRNPALDVPPPASHDKHCSN